MPLIAEAARRKSISVTTVTAVVVRLVNVLAGDYAVTRAVRHILIRVGLVVAPVVTHGIPGRIVITFVMRGHVRRFRTSGQKSGDDARAKQ